MAKDRFDDLLRRMPKIADAVNAFSSEHLQQRAFQALIEEYKQMQGGKDSSDETASGATGGEPKKSAASDKAKAAAGGPAMSTADILAMARSGGGKPEKNGKQPAEKATAEPAKPEETAAEPKLSPVEGIKTESNFLAGTIADELVDENDFFGKESIQLLKHHGTYQQDNRDVRGKGAGGKSDRSYMFMVRTKSPGGKLTSDQLLSELDLGDEVGNDTLRITTRQGLQLHGVVKSDLHATIRRINEIQLSTLGACGDVNRNVMCCPAPYRSRVYQQIQEMADTIAAHLAPRTPAYHEIWLRDLATNEDEKVAGGLNPGDVIEPIYGTHYLPRKFKIGIALPHDNCIDLYTHDLGLLAIHENDTINGYNVVVGGGMGVTPSAEKTFPALAKKLAFVTPEQALDVVTAVVKVQRDFGYRDDRKRARLKYLIHDWGIERFKAKVEEYYGSALPDPSPIDVHGFNDHMGWDEQGGGRVFYGLNVENGRIADTETMKLKTAIREICRTFQPGIRLTSHQSILFTDLEPEVKGDFEAILRKHGVKLTEEISTVRRWSMACVAWPTCGLSITEAERALPSLMDEMEAELAKLGLSKEKFTVRMTGCPNGCARPYNSDIGLVGKTKGKYTLFVGGRLLGNRLNFIYQDLVPEEEVVSTLVPLFTFFKQHRENGETFGDFCHRQGRDRLLAWADEFAAAAS
ncbi:MAG: NADPH-dependent assimilatory sulfite reductase hemoprotein subunit [Pirellulaceae bacterium]